MLHGAQTVSSTAASGNDFIKYLVKANAAAAASVAPSVLQNKPPVEANETKTGKRNVVASSTDVIAKKADVCPSMTSEKTSVVGPSVGFGPESIYLKTPVVVAPTNSVVKVILGIYRYPNLLFQKRSYVFSGRIFTF